jgi:hypothetical protein
MKLDLSVLLPGGLRMESDISLFHSPLASHMPPTPPHTPPIPVPNVTYVCCCLGVRDDEPDVAASPAHYVPRWGFKLEGAVAITKVSRPSSIFEMQKFASRLLSAGRVIQFIARRLPAEHTFAAARVGEPVPPERSSPRCATDAKPADAMHVTRSQPTAAHVPREVLQHLLLALYAKRQITGGSSAVYGHVDTFGGEVDDDLENKQTIQLRDDDAWCSGPHLGDLPDVGLLPGGALGYARTKAATICRAGRDMEFHQLSRAIHLSGDTARWVAAWCESGVPTPMASETRGVWGADGYFHPFGVALCDWWETYSARRQRAFLHAHGRQLVLQPNGLYQYFGHAG